MIYYVLVLLIIFCFLQLLEETKQIREVVAAIIHGTEALINDLSKHGIEIHNTGGETADVGDLVLQLLLIPL